MALRQKLGRLAKAVGFLWAIVGITLVLFIVMQWPASLWIAARPPVQGDCSLDDSDIFAQEPWRDEWMKDVKGAFEQEWVPFVYWRHKPHSSTYINIDADGLRRTWNAPAGERALRVDVYGGSTTWGIGNRDEHTIPSELARQLSDAGLHVRVRNLAQPGWVSTQELLQFVFNLKAEPPPDLAIFVDGFNDRAVEELTAAGASWIEGNLQKNRELRNDQRELALQLFRNTPLGELLAGKHYSPYTIPNKPTELGERARQVARNYIGNVQIAERLAATYALPVRFFWQPTINRKQLRAPYEAKMVGGRWISNMVPLLEASSALVTQALAGDATFKNIEDLFAQVSEPRFVDCCHYSERGANEIAARITAEVVPILAARARALGWQ